MKNTSLLISLVFVVALVYTAFSFIMWDLNPHTWGEGSRILFVLVSAGLCVPLLGIHYESKTYND